MKKVTRPINHIPMPPVTRNPYEVARDVHLAKDKKTVIKLGR